MGGGGGGRVLSNARLACLRETKYLGASALQATVTTLKDRLGWGPVP